MYKWCHFHPQPLLFSQKSYQCIVLNFQLIWIKCAIPAVIDCVITWTCTEMHYTVSSSVMLRDTFQWCQINIKESETPSTQLFVHIFFFTFLRRAMNCGTRRTGKWRLPTTSLHIWPITWDIKGVCVCLNIIAPSIPLTDKTVCIVLQF